MKILVTGAKGFVGKNLVAELKNKGYEEIFEYDKDSNLIELDEFTKDCTFVFHLAGVNRPERTEEFMEGNYGFTGDLLRLLKKHANTAPVLITSSIHAKLDNPYGLSKKAGEDLLFNYAKETGAKVYVYRLANLFGKWSKPNYNSAVATFCHNIAHGLEIKVNDPDALLTLCYIDDVIQSFVHLLDGNPFMEGSFCKVPVEYNVKLGQVANLIMSFHESRNSLMVPDMSEVFTKKLYSTYLSYLPEDDFAYDLRMNVDNRGSFTEFLKTNDRGQVSINVSKPGITKGNHWHHTKNEKFLVVSGEGIIRFRKIDTTEIIEYKVSGDKLKVVDIPIGYTHSIENVGETDMVTVMWANELLDKENPDTYYMEVK